MHYVALLRGINVGRAKRIGMADLRALLSGAGYTDVATLLQSGNVVLTSDRPAADVARSVEGLILERFGFPVDVIVRTHDELAHVLATDPFGDVADDGARYFVAFMASPPGDTVLAGVDAGDDLFTVDGRELYVWCPNGLLESPLMQALGKVKGGPVTTVRNWNTVRRLATMLRLA